MISGVSVAHATNTINSTFERNFSDNAFTQSFRPGVAYVTLDHGNGSRCKKNNDKAIKNYRIDFTNWHVVLNHIGVICYIVSIPGLKFGANHNTFYYFCTSGDGNATIYRCDKVPDGMLTIVLSSWWAICLNHNVTSKVNNENMELLVDPKIVHENYEKDYCSTLFYNAIRFLHVVHY